MSPVRILVVDDSRVMRRSILFALAQLEDFTCVEAEDGADALRKFHEERFDLVLTDVNMPRMDGLKLIGHIRRTHAQSALPLVVITTEAGEADGERALALGANIYLVKPLQTALLLETVRALVHVKA